MKKGQWTFLTNHARVLSYIAVHPRATGQEIAQVVGLSVRGIQKIISDLKISGYIVQQKEGRCNCYTVQMDRPMRHRLEFSHPVGNLLKAIDAFPEIIARRERADIVQEGVAVMK